MSHAAEPSLVETVLTRRDVLTLSVSAGLLGCYWLYSQTVTPRVTPPPIAMVTHSGDPSEDDDAGPLLHRQMAEAHLPFVPWAAEAAYQFRTETSFIYTQTAEQVDEDRAIRLSPFAMIYLQEGRKEDEAPITILSDSAYVRFAEKFELSRPGDSRVVAGALEGPVEIRGPDGLHLRGRNFVFSEDSMRIWSDEPVRFVYGPHRGEGRGMQVELIREEAARRKGQTSVEGIKSVKLLRDVVMYLQVDRDDPTAVPARRDGRAADRGDRHKPGPKEPATVQVRSTGSFEYAMQSHTASFRDDVRVNRPTDPGKYDVLYCDVLTLTFEPRPESEPADGATRPSDGSAATAAKDDGRKEPPKQRRSNDSRFRGLDSNLEFRRLEARAQPGPAVPQRAGVVLISQDNELTARMDRLVFDAQTNVVELSDPRLVHVEQKGSEIHAPKITLLRDERRRIRRVTCDGAGWLRSYDKSSGRLQLAAQWDGRLQKYPDGDTGLDIIELEENVVVRQPEDETGLAAEFIKLWFEQLRKEVRSQESGVGSQETGGRRQAAGGRTQESGGRRQVAGGSQRTTDDGRLTTDNPQPSTLDPQPTDRSSRIRLDRMLALGRPHVQLDRQNPNQSAGDVQEAKYVVMVGRGMQLYTKRLEVWFEQQAEGGSQGSGGRGQESSVRGQRSGVSGQRSEVRDQRIEDRGSRIAPKTTQHSPLTTHEPDRQSSIVNRQSDSGGDPFLAGRHAQPPAAGGDEGDDLPRSDEGPLEVVSELTRVRVLQGPGRRDVQVSEIWTAGGVRVRQDHGLGVEPLTMSGDRMHIVSRGRDEQVVHLYGGERMLAPGRPSPAARIDDRGMHIEADRLHFDRSRNLSWVEGAGMLRMPIDRSLDGEKLDQPRPLEVWWREQMTFDGRTAKFIGDVRSVSGEDRLSCEQMDVVFTQPISFAQRDGERDGERDTEVESIHCRDGVGFESRESGQGRVTQIRQGRFAEFTLHRSTGKTNGRGPGWIVLWRRGGGNRAGLSPLGNVQANRGGESRSGEWEYTRIDFDGRAVGNINDRFNTFHDGVQIVYGPVERPPQTIDPDNLPRDGGWMRCRTLEVTQVPAIRDRPAYVTLLGRGNAELEGRTFRARADEVTFDESKGLYTLRSLGARQATIWRQLVPGGEYSAVTSQRMEFIPSRNHLEHLKLDGATGLQGLQ